MEREEPSDENEYRCKNTVKPEELHLTKDSYTWNITHNKESTAVWSLKPEQWGSPLVQEQYQEEKACDKRHP